MGLKQELKELQQKSRGQFINIAREFAQSKFEEVNRDMINLTKDCASFGKHDVEFEALAPLHIRELSAQVLGDKTARLGTLDVYRLGMYRDEILSLLRREHPDIDFRIRMDDATIIYINWA